MSGQMSGRLVAVLLGLVLVGTSVGCGGDDPASAPVTSAATVTVEGDDPAAVEVCRQATTSMAVMVREYNIFIRRLNETHDYADLSPLDRYARETLTTGSEIIGEKLTAEVPEHIADPTRQFLETTDRLAALIGERRTTGLNTVADRWTEQRRVLLDVCGQVLPTPSVSVRLPDGEDGADGTEVDDEGADGEAEYRTLTPDADEVYR